MASHEVALAYGDMRRVSELEAQLASAQANLLLAQADAEALRAAIRHFTQAHDMLERLCCWDEMDDAARAEHPGQALADEVAAGRALVAIARGWVVTSADCPCARCVDLRAVLAAYDAAVKA